MPFSKRGPSKEGASDGRRSIRRGALLPNEIWKFPRFSRARRQSPHRSTQHLLFKRVVVQPPGLNARSALPVLREVDDRRLGQNSDLDAAREQAFEEERERRVKEVFARMMRDMDRGGSSTDTDDESSSEEERTAYCQGKDVMNDAERSEVRKTCAKRGHICYNLIQI